MCISVVCSYSTVECCEDSSGVWCPSGEGVKAQVALYSLRQNFHPVHFTQCDPWSPRVQTPILTSFSVVQAQKHKIAIFPREM